MWNARADACRKMYKERQEIETKIESGFYTSNEVTESVAGQVAAASQETKIDLSKTEITPTRMQQVLEKIRDNQYDSAGVVDIIADRILKDL